MGKIEFRDLNIFGLKAKMSSEIKGRSSGAQFGTKWSVYYLRNIHTQLENSIWGAQKWNNMYISVKVGKNQFAAKWGVSLNAERAAIFDEIPSRIPNFKK